MGKDKRWGKRGEKKCKKLLKKKKIWLKAFDYLTFLMFPLESLRFVIDGEQVVDDEERDFADELDEDNDANLL